MFYDLPKAVQPIQLNHYRCHFPPIDLQWKSPTLLPLPTKPLLTFQAEKASRGGRRRVRRKKKIANSLAQKKKTELATRVQIVLHQTPPSRMAVKMHTHTYIYIYICTFLVFFLIKKSTHVPFSKTATSCSNAAGILFNQPLGWSTLSCALIDADYNRGFQQHVQKRDTGWNRKDYVRGYNIYYFEIVWKGKRREDKAEPPVIETIWSCAWSSMYKAKSSAQRKRWRDTVLDFLGTFTHIVIYIVQSFGHRAVSCAQRTLLLGSLVHRVHGTEGWI